jgi:hypothetical protein
MHRRIFANTLLALAAGFLLVALPAVPGARAQNGEAPPVSITLYSGDPGSVVLGRAEANTETVLVGSESIRVTTQGLYQGALLTFPQPIDLAPAFANRNTYLRLQVRFAPGGAGAGGGGPTQEVFDPSTGEVRRAAASPFDRMRFVLTMADGSRHELIRPVEVKGTDDPEAWVYIAFPIEAVLRKPAAAATTTTAAGAGATEGAAPAPAPAAPAAPAPPTGNAAKLSSLAIFGDRYQQFFISDISVITDDTDINVDPLEEQVGFVGAALVFSATAEGGASTLRYEWDLDGDKKTDRTGSTIQHFWRKPGKYPVTVTVSDVDGLKKPASTTVTIDVAE